MSEDEMKLEEMEKLCNEATPGPWNVFVEDGDEDKGRLLGMRQWTDHRFSLNDACFIAASRMLMPKLLAVAKAANMINWGDVNSYGYISGTKEIQEALEELEKE